ncbi:autophagy-related 12 isoform X1 [Arctopsyche grandis]|uniref:autophagy-related 12 isoform X1 n=1 Tax=Arctopsyche grandis TaxID=121162 RepID=UPI00406D964E
MSEDNPADESLPADVSLGVGLMSLDSNQDTPRSDSNGGTVVKTDKLKIDILLKATGNAPIMKKKKWAVDAEKPIGWIMEFVKKYLKLDANEKLFLYVNQTFAPSPDQIVRNLYECFGTDGKLILHYCKSQAWG